MFSPSPCPRHYPPDPKLRAAFCAWLRHYCANAVLRSGPLSMGVKGNWQKFVANCGDTVPIFKIKNTTKMIHHVITLIKNKFKITG